MSICLPLTLEALEVVTVAHEREEGLDLEQEAKRLVEAHPEADVDRKVVVDLLQEEQAAADCSLL